MKQKPLFILIILLVLVSLACGKFSLGKPTSTPEPTATKDILPSATSEPTKLPTQPAPTDTPEVVEEPTQPPQQSQEGVKVDQVFFVQQETTLVYAFYVTNFEADSAYEDSEYDIVVYGENDEILQTSYGYLSLLRANEKLGVVNTLYMDEGQVAKRVDIGFKPGEAVADNTSSPFEVDKVTFYEDEFFPTITCTLQNTSNKDITDVIVSALAFDENGNFIGGGYTYQYFLLSGSTTGSTISFYGAGTPARVEVYPTLSGFSELRDVPTGTPEMIIDKMGTALESNRVGLVFFVKNTLADKAIEGSYYQVTIFDGEGLVLGTTAGYVHTVLPGSLDPVYVDVFLPNNSVPDNYIVQVLSGEVIDPPYPTIPFTIKDIVYLPDDWSPSATGTLVNSLAEPVEGLSVVAVAYNEAGEIIGGGYSHVDVLPANGTLAIETWLTISGDAATVEMYPLIASFTKVGGE